MRMNRKGVIGMPVRLAAAFLILAVTVPILAGAAGNLEKESDTAELRRQAEIISSAAEKTYYAGRGAIFTAEVSIAGDCRLELGGTGSDAYKIKMFRGDEETGCLVMERPPVRFNEPVVLTGDTSLRFWCVMKPDGCAVEVDIVA